MKQIIIVGAGPTGASLSLLLVKQGIKVILVEASRDFQRQFRGEGLMPSGLAALEEMGLSSLLESIPTREIDAWEVLINGRSLFQVNEPFSEGGKPCTLVSQPHLLEGIIKESKNYSNFEFISGQRVTKLLKDESERVSGVYLGNGRELIADLVVGADGRNSTIRKQANIELTKQSSAIDILWFKLSPGSLLGRKNIFYSIVKDRFSFGLFRSSQGNLHIGWGLHKEDDYEWKNTNWRKTLADVSPDWLAEHIRDKTTQITKPLLLSVTVGSCSQWSRSGLLLLGDAVHPMSPIRAQGINMALQDAIVASNYLIPMFKNSVDNLEIDAVLPKIQAVRQPEIIRVQKLQTKELAQAEKLRNYSVLRFLVSNLAPVVGFFIRFSWLNRQKAMR